MRDRFYPGTRVKVVARFRDPETHELAAVEEPVSIRVQPPGDEAVREGVPVVKDAEGLYHAVFLADVEGMWATYGASSGETASVDEGSFEVRPSAFE